VIGTVTALESGEKSLPLSSTTTRAARLAAAENAEDRRQSLQGTTSIDPLIGYHGPRTRISCRPYRGMAAPAHRDLAAWLSVVKAAAGVGLRGWHSGQR
jgi:hypothetical protein